MTPLIEQFKGIKSYWTREKLALLIFTVSVCATWFFITQEHGWGGTHNLYSSYIFTADSHLDHIGPNHNPKLAGGHFNGIHSTWKGRILSLWCAGRLMDLLNPESVDEMNFAVGFYQLAWFVATITLLWLSKLYNLRVLLLIFAGLMYGLTPEATMYPWDMPSMFMWTLVYVLWIKEKYHWMVAFLIFGTLFKETVAVLAFLLFFTKLPRRRQAALFSICFLGCVVVRLVVTHYVLGQTALVNLAVSPGIPRIDFLASAENFFTTPFNLTIFFAGAGLVFVSFLLPIDRSIKWILGIMFVSVTIEPILCQGAYECRLFDDIVPVLAIQLRNLKLDG